MHFTPAQLQQFKIDGYLVLAGALNEQRRLAIRELALRHLDARIKPFELEAELQYPGAPTSDEAAGGDTIRRLLLADRRDGLLLDAAQLDVVCGGIQDILGCDSLLLNPNHHNCIMTKQPAYSSETLWHRDTRYWHFSDKYLVNAWYALGDELNANGAMKILPGSHRWDVQDHALDSDQFLILDHPDNQDRLATARTVELQAGDVLLFSAHCFHAAGRNTTRDTKLSLVFTYHAESTQACPDTRSAHLAPIKLAPI